MSTFSRDAKCLRTMILILLEGWGYNNHRLLNFLREKTATSGIRSSCLHPLKRKKKAKPHLRHGRRCSQSAPINRVLIGQTRMQSRPGPCKRVLGLPSNVWHRFEEMSEFLSRRGRPPLSYQRCKSAGKKRPWKLRVRRNCSVGSSQADDGKLTIIQASPFLSHDGVQWLGLQG